MPLRYYRTFIDVEVEDEVTQDSHGRAKFPGRLSSSWRFQVVPDQGRGQLDCSYGDGNPFTGGLV